MKNSVCIKFALLVCSLSCSIPNVFAQTKDTMPVAVEQAPTPQSFENLSEQEQKEVMQAFLKDVDNLYKQTIDLYQKIDTLLEELALMIQNNVIKAKNKSALIGQIKDIRQLIDKIRRDSPLTVEPQTIFILLSLHKALLNHIDAAAKKGLQELPAFDVQGFLSKRHVPIDLSFEMLQEMIYKGNEQLKTLHAESTKIGLTWYNKVFRKLADFDYKYHALTLGGKAALTAGLWTLYWAYATGWFYKPGYSEADQANPKEIAELEDKPTLAETDKSALKQIPGFLQAYNTPRLPRFLQIYRSMLPKGGSQPYFAETVSSAPREIIEYEINPKINKSWLKWSLAHLIGKQGMQAHRTTGQQGLLGILDALLHDGRAGLIPFGAALGTYTYNLWQPELKYAQELVTDATKLISGRLQGGIEKAQVEKEQQIIPTITFDDIVGLDHAKEVLMDLVHYIEDPERFDLVKLTPEKGYLLAGPSRTGKSYIAEALGGEIHKVLERTGRSKDDFAFYDIKAQTIINRGIEYLHALAKNSAPCILFIDEIDLLGLQRAGGNLELLSQFLSSMSGYLNNNGRKQVIILAATNKPENLDEALRKRGRFGKIINFNYPTFEERKELLKRKLEALAIDVSHFDLDLIAQQTEGRTFEDLNAMLKSALKKAKLSGTPLTQDHLNDALNDEIRNILGKENKNVTDHELDILAAQIAGRAMVHAKINCTRGLSGATIAPISTHIAEQTVFERLNKKEKETDSTVTQQAIEYGGIFTHYNFDTLRLESREDRLNECKVLVAGNIAEKLLLGSCGFSYRPGDHQKAFDIIKQLVFTGIKMEDLSKNLKNQYLDDCHNLLKQCEQEVTEILTQNLDKLKALSTELKKHKTLTAEQIKTVINIPLVPSIA